MEPKPKDEIHLHLMNILHMQAEGNFIQCFLGCLHFDLQPVTL